MSRILILKADARRIPLRDGTVDLVVTSPPYWGLRKYPDPAQIGLEATPAAYVAEMVAVFREVWRVLKPTGSVYLNLGDCYATGAGKVGDHPGGGAQGERWRGGHEGKHGQVGPMTQPNRMPLPGLKPKDMVGVPWRVAFALQDAGWRLREDIIWSKRNPMPESVKDRCTRSHEYIFHLTKAERYYYNAEAIVEPFASTEIHRAAIREVRGFDTRDGIPGIRSHRSKTEATPHLGGRRQAPEPGEPNAFGKNGRNARSVWDITTQPYPGAHFATFPEEIPRRCILAASPRGGVVLDPFAGSGTVGRVAVANGRLAVMVDLAYHDQQVKRTSGVAMTLPCMG